MAAIKTIAAGHTHADGLCIGDAATSKLAFNGSTPVTQPSGAGQAIPTDLASVIVFCTKIRLDLVTLGLIKGSA